MEGTFHRRELLEPAVAFSSHEGRSLFASALADGTMEAYFRLSEQYTTQGHPAFCGIGSLTMALNALLVDPQRKWQGVWRWYDESMLDCCESLDVIRAKGITLPKLACLARCNGTDATLHHGSEMSVEEFRELVVRCSTCAGDGCEGCCIIVSYARAELNQTGSGHFSPIGGYHRESDMVLIMDVARFKYPPHWVPLEQLHTAMCTIDEDSGKCRGCLVLTPSATMREYWCRSADMPPQSCCSPTGMRGIPEIEELAGGVPPCPDPAERAEQLSRNRSNTGAAIGALWGISDGSPEETVKETPIQALCKHRCSCCK